MSSTLDKLGLSPAEKRLVVFVGLALFVVLNIWLIWPKFGKVSFWQQRRKDALKVLQSYQAEIQKRSTYERQMRELEQRGAAVASAEQALQLQRIVSSQAAVSGVSVQRYDPGRQATRRSTNSFFEEQTLVITVNTGEKELVNFLYNLGKQNQLIRVRGMNLAPDPSGSQLRGTITLVASFQKKAPPRRLPAATRPASPGSTNAATNRPPAQTTRPARQPPARSAPPTSRK